MNKLKNIWFIIRNVDFIGIPNNPQTEEEIQQVLQVIYTLKNKFEQKMMFINRMDNSTGITLNIEKTKATLCPVIESIINP